MARNTEANNVETTEEKATRNVKKITPRAEAIVAGWEDLMGLHRSIVLSAGMSAFNDLPADVQAQYITQAIADARSAANGTS